MAHCKHWKNGHCKDCRKHCPIKKKLIRQAARVAASEDSACPEAAMEFAVAPPALIEALAHGQRVARLAAKLYAELAPLHRLEAPWGDVLTVAAHLHDVGWVYGQKGHHKVSARMIRTKARELGALSLPGIAWAEGAPLPEAVDSPDSANMLARTTVRPLAALVARYHRRADPSPRQRRFAALSGAERRGVRCMAAVLRVADALDYSHANCVHDIEIIIEEDTVRLILDCPGGCAEEVTRLEVKKTLFKKVFKRDVLCQCINQKASAAPDAQRNVDSTPGQTTVRATKQKAVQAKTPATPHAAKPVARQSPPKAKPATATKSGGIASKPKKSAQSPPKVTTPTAETPTSETSAMDMPSVDTPPTVTAKTEPTAAAEK